MASSCLNWLESIEEWSKKWDKTSHQKSNKSDIDDRSADGWDRMLNFEASVTSYVYEIRRRWEGLSTDVNECWPTWAIVASHTFSGLRHSFLPSWRKKRVTKPEERCCVGGFTSPTWGPPPPQKAQNKLSDDKKHGGVWQDVNWRSKWHFHLVLGRFI